MDNRSSSHLTGSPVKRKHSVSSHTNSSSSATTTIKKKAWTPSEDQHLKSLVLSNSERDQVTGRLSLKLTWGELAEYMTHRSAKQCRERWCYNLDDRINHAPFSVEEDAVLLKAQRSFANQWALIARYLPGRTENAVKTRHKSIMRAKRREWTREEDDLLTSLYTTLGAKWDEIKLRFSNRTANALKTRVTVLKRGLQKIMDDEVENSEGNPRQIWLNTDLIDTIDLHHFIKHNEEEDETTPQADSQPIKSQQQTMTEPKGVINESSPIIFSPVEQATEMLVQGIDAVFSAVVSDQNIGTQDKEGLLQQTSQLFQSYMEAKKNFVKRRMLNSGQVALV